MTRILGVTGLLAIAAGSASARPDSITVRDSVGGQTSLGAANGFYLIPTGGRIDLTGPLGTGFLGSGTFDFDQKATGGGTWFELHTYCLEPGVQLGFEPQPVGGEVVYKKVAGVPLLSATEEGQIEVLWKNAFETSKTSALNAAAFQLILWELTADNSYDLNAGSFHVNLGGVHNALTLAARDLANDWFDNIGDSWTEATQLASLIHPQYQDLLVPLEFPTIPLPSAGLMGLAGLGLIGGLRRRSEA